MNNANGNIKYFVVVDDAASAEDKDKDGDPDALSTPPLQLSSYSFNLPSFLPPVAVLLEDARESKSKC